MREAVIVAAKRTPIGKAYRGAFNNACGATLARVDPSEIDDVAMDAAMQQGATGSNIARRRLCAPKRDFWLEGELTAINSGCQRVLDHATAASLGELTFGGDRYCRRPPAPGAWTCFCARTLLEVSDAQRQ